MTSTSLVERAFQLARDPEINSISDIRAALRREGYTELDAYLSGKSLKDQLLAMIRERRAA